MERYSDAGYGEVVEIAETGRLRNVELGVQSDSGTDWQGYGRAGVRNVCYPVEPGQVGLGVVHWI